MQIRIVMGLAALAALAGCDMLQNMNPMGGGGNAMIDAIKDQPAMYSVQLPPNAAVGTWWEMDMSGMKQKTCVVAEKDGKFVVEQISDMGGTMLVQAFLVDPTVDLAQVPVAGEEMANNVSAAWVGAEGDEPIERKVMAPMKVPEATGGTAEPVDMESGKETVTLAGNSFDTEWTEVAGSKTWMIEGTLFLLKSVSGGNTTMEISGWGNDAKPALKWDGDKEE
ncbi:MAG: hypothetical protein AB8H80_14395 [Planctomycetota bacterium]